MGLSPVPNAWDRVVKDLEGWRVLPGVHPTLYLLLLGFPSLPLLAPGSSHGLGILFLAAVI